MLSAKHNMRFKFADASHRRYNYIQSNERPERHTFTLFVANGEMPAAAIRVRLPTVGDLSGNQADKLCPRVAVFC